MVAGIFRRAGCVGRDGRVFLKDLAGRRAWVGVDRRTAARVCDLSWACRLDRAAALRLRPAGAWTVPIFHRKGIACRQTWIGRLAAVVIEVASGAVTVARRCRSDLRVGALW